MQTCYEDNARTVFLRRAGHKEMCLVHSLAKTQIGGDVATASVMQKVWRHNRDVAWLIGHQASGDIVGFYLFLFFNENGLRAYEQQLVDTLDPDVSLLTPDGGKPEAVYLWGVVARGLADRTFPLIVQALPKERYGGVPILAKAATPGGAYGLKRYGFGRQHVAETGEVGDVFRLNREPAYRPGIRPRSVT